MGGPLFFSVQEASQGSSGGGGGLAWGQAPWSWGWGSLPLVKYVSAMPWCGGKQGRGQGGVVCGLEKICHDLMSYHVGPTLGQRSCGSTSWQNFASHLYTIGIPICTNSYCISCVQWHIWYGYIHFGYLVGIEFNLNTKIQLSIPLCNSEMWSLVQVWLWRFLMILMSTHLSYGVISILAIYLIWISSTTR